MNNEINIYTILDLDTGKRGPLLEAPNDVVAMRHFRTQLLRIPKHVRKRMDLWKIGRMDDDLTFKIELLEELVMEGKVMGDDNDQFTE